MSLSLCHCRRMLPLFGRATAEFKEAHSVGKYSTEMRHHETGIGSSHLPWHTKKASNNDFKSRSVRDIRNGIEMPLAHIHPSRPMWDMSKGYCILLVQSLVNESIRSHPTAQKTYVKRHPSLILYSFYAEKAK